MEMPKLKRCTLMGGLKNVKSVKMENAGKLESVKGLKEAMEEERKKREEEEKKRREEAERRKREEAERRKKEEEEIKRREEAERKKKEEERKREEMMALAKTTVSVRNVGDLRNANSYVGVIVIASNCCNDTGLSVIDLNRFVNLRELKVGDECFEHVKEVKLIGLNQLERVVIGEKSFTGEKYFRAFIADRHFHLKNCERLRELKVGCHSFSDYSVCEIENVPSLEVIEMGDMNEYSFIFRYASLELKSDSERMK